MSNHSYKVKDNPFESKASSKSYKNADPVYTQSAVNAVEFLNPRDYASEKLNIVDLGGGTGVSTSILLQACNELDDFNLSIVEPAEAMLNEAKLRLGDKVSYLQASADQLSQFFTQELDLIYALNCVHLFPDMDDLASSVNNALKPSGSFVFNLSRPSYKFDDINELERASLEANFRFYEKLYEAMPDSPILASTLLLLADSIEGKGEQIHSKNKFQEIFSSVNMEIADYKEFYIKTEAIYQQNIWRIVASGFISDSQEVDSLISAVTVPEEINFRQAFFKLCKKP